MKRYMENIWSMTPLSFIKGYFSAFVAFPIAERYEKRIIRTKLKELRNCYKQSIDVRMAKAHRQLSDIIEFSGIHVPYYRDLFKSIKFDPYKVRKDYKFLNDLPFLTKDIIREQKNRLLSRPLENTRHYACKTGGSTGPSCVIYYDQNAADHSSAVTIYARERIGKFKHRSELHFACRFPDAKQTQWPNREDFKCLAMNRSNIFFDRLDDKGLQEIWQTLKRRKPFLIHGHPSTIFTLACYVKQNIGRDKAFEIFESSGELLENYQRNTIEQALKCKVINRYGSAEFGVIAYELDGIECGFQVLESEGWPESILLSESVDNEQEFVFTGFRNKLMPLIRYRTGDFATVQKNDKGFQLINVVGRIHDFVPINGISHATHHVQDMLDHRIGGIQEFQIDLRTSPPTLKIVPENTANPELIRVKISQYWGTAFNAQFVGHNDLIRVGRHAKFRHVVHS